MTATAQEPTFVLPPELSATTPPERRGLRRDAVRLLVARPDRIEHARFRDLPRYLMPGDIVVVNTSGTLPAAVDAYRATGEPVVVHFSTERDDGRWIVELRPADGRKEGPVRDGHVGEHLLLDDGATLILDAAFPAPDVRTGSRLWLARLRAEASVVAYLRRHGRPIRYGYVEQRWSLDDYQNVFVTEAGSAEMPSAGRPFTPELLTALMAWGVTVAPLLLHTGVSSLDAHERPYAERFTVPAPTARLVNSARGGGGRVVAVGTTVVRALESVVSRAGEVEAGGGWTDLVLSPERPTRVVDGLVTGLHAPGSSHLRLLEAVAGHDLVQAAYAAAVRERYLWHEFGDSCLLLP
ncbi:MAG: S-adenosylmethionine:tRNA ribosyltransferase-isomerase [Candidatus Nanopelagicales bacterium]